MNRYRHLRWDRIIGVAATFIIGIGIITWALIPSPVVEYEMKDIVVHQGDTLWSIAREAVGDTEDIRKAVYEIKRDNQLTNDAIRPGDVLRVKVVKEP